MIKNIRNYFKLEVSGLFLEYGILGISSGILFFVTADYVGYGWLQGLSPFQSMVLGFIASFFGVLFLGHFIISYIKFKLKYKVYIQIRKILVIFSMWFFIIIYYIFLSISSWMKVLVFPVEILVVLIFVFVFYFNVVVEEINNSVRDYMENLTLNETEKDEG